MHLVDTLKPSEAQLLRDSRDFLRKCGFLRHLRENGLLGQRFGTRMSYSYVNGKNELSFKTFRLPNLPFPRGLSETELQAIQEREPWRISEGKCRKAGWFYCGNNLWIAPWNLERALIEAKIEHGRRWKVLEGFLKEMVGFWSFGTMPIRLVDHLIERVMWRQAIRIYWGVRCELVDLFTPDGSAFAEDRARLQEWWESVDEDDQKRYRAWWESVKRTITERREPLKVKL